jgi:hypothetical protein
VANAFVGAGLADFVLIGFHFQKTGLVATELIPVYYAAAVAAGAIEGLVFGKLFDKFGLIVLLAIFFCASFFAPFVFLGKSWIALFVMVLWGVAMGTQASLLNAVIAGVVGLTMQHRLRCIRYCIRHRLVRQQRVNGYPLREINSRSDRLFGRYAIVVASNLLARETASVPMSDVDHVNRAPKVASQNATRFARNQAIRKTCGHLLGQAVCSKRGDEYLFGRSLSPR